MWAPQRRETSPSSDVTVMRAKGGSREEGGCLLWIPGQGQVRFGTLWICSGPGAGGELDLKS